MQKKNISIVKILHCVQNDKSKESGRTMMEMLGVLSIMGLLMYGAVNSINSGMTSYKVNQMYIEIGNITKGIQDMYMSVYGRGSYPTLNCNTDDCTSGTDCGGCNGLIQNKILMAKNGSPILKGLTIQTTSEGGLTITFKTKKDDICNRLKEMDWQGQSLTVAGGCTDPDYILTFTAV